LKLFIGTAQILTSDKVQIFTDGNINSKAKLFRMYKKCNGNKVDRYVLWIPNKSLNNERIIFMIDLSSKDVGQPNSSADDYRLYCDYFLLQSENGDHFISFHDGVKGSGHDSNLFISEQTIQFKVPDDLKAYKIIRIEF